MSPRDKSASGVSKVIHPPALTKVADAATWLEHMEQETEIHALAEEAADRDLLLQNSPADLATYESLKRVRAAVKSLNDDVALPESGLFYDQLHAKIMAAIDEEDAASAQMSQRQGVLRSRFSWPTMFRAASVTMMLAFITWFGLHQKASLSPKVSDESTVAAHAAAIGESFERNVASVDAHAGAEFAHDMGSFESDEDFVTEAAESRLQQVSRHDAEAMLKSLKM